MKLNWIQSGQLRPRTRFGWFSMFVVAAYVLLKLAQWVGFRSPGISFIIDASLVVVIIRYLFRFFRWASRKLLWRLRRRLVVTYLLVGIVPVVLLFLIILILGEAFLGQLGSHFISSDLDRLSSRMDIANRAMASTVLTELSDGTLSTAVLDRQFGSLMKDLNSVFPRVSIGVEAGSNRASFEIEDGQISFKQGQVGRPSWSQRELSGIFQENGRTIFASVVGGDPGVGGWMIMSAPLDSGMLLRLCERNEVAISVLTLAPASTAVRPGEMRFRFGEKEYVQKDARLVDSETAAKYTQRLSWYDFSTPRFPFFLSNIRDWASGASDVTAIYLVNSTWLRLARRLFAEGFSGQENVIGYALVAVSIIFLFIEFAALISSVLMTRTITGAVYNLDEGAQHIMRGDFSHRIPVKVRDQLSSLGQTFNTMTASIERLLKEQSEKQRLESELAIALEVQKQLFPQRAPKLSNLQIAGVCNPARIVSGDYYDYLSIAPTLVGLAVGDVSGKGVSAALLMASLQAALRSHSSVSLLSRSAGADGRLLSGGGVGSLSLRVSEIVSLLNEQLYQNTPTEKYVTFFFGVYDEQHRRLTYTNAGHLPPLVFNSSGVHRLETGGTVLGLLRDVEYQQGGVQLNPEDVVVAYTDGITEAENSFEEQFTERRLIQTVQRVLNQPPDKIVETILDAVSGWVETGEPQDDMTLIVAKAT